MTIAMEIKRLHGRTALPASTVAAPAIHPRGEHRPRSAGLAGDIDESVRDRPKLHAMHAYSSFVLGHQIHFRACLRAQPGVLGRRRRLAARRADHSDDEAGRQPRAPASPPGRRGIGGMGRAGRLLWSCQRGDLLVSRGQLGRESAPVLAELGNGVGLALDRLSLPADRGVLHGQPFGQGSDRRRDRC